tara:strand:- start:17457 stop:18608 length:1152 start_codon:yes stop_codon:yes gene_type:complete
MARKKIREFTAKKILLDKLGLHYPGLLVTAESMNQFNLDGKCVGKPDMLFGGRGKLGLVKIGSADEVKQFILQKSEDIVIGNAKGKLTHWLIEPFVEHDKEFYLSFSAEREADVIYFSEHGGVDIEENWDQVKKIEVPVLQEFTLNICDDAIINQFVKKVFSLFRELNFTYLEFNPCTLVDGKVVVLDTVAKVDSCADWNDFPEAFGRTKCQAERNVEKLDANSGASLKLTILNEKGKIWNILGGGGASIIYLDMIANLGMGDEIANYGEASGNPSEDESYLYAMAILKMMLENNGKILFIVGGIANFTNVKDTFSGYVRALKEFGAELRAKEIIIFVRRGGPNWQEGISLMKDVCKDIGLEAFVHGPDTSMPEIITLARDHL